MLTYDPKRIVISIAAILINRGFAEEGMVKVVQTSKRFESAVGTDGEVTRVRLYDGRALVTISLMQSSAANDALSALHLLDLRSPNGLGVGAFQMRDLNGTTLVKAPQAWITGLPETEFSKKIGSRQWEIELSGNENSIIGGAINTP